MNSMASWLVVYLVTSLQRLMGPRRKLTLAISELKEQEQNEEDEGKRGGPRSSGEEASCKTSRPQLQKQSSTDVTEAYRQVYVRSA